MCLELAGAGKTTAIDFLERQGLGTRLYVGQLIVDEVSARGLPPGPESELAVRESLREQHGLAAAASLAVVHVNQLCSAGSNVLLDAILFIEELKFYQDNCSGDVRLVLIDAAFEIRAKRLAERSDKKLSLQDLRARDQFEKGGIPRSAAEFYLLNESGMQEFYDGILEIVRVIR